MVVEVNRIQKGFGSLGTNSSGKAVFFKAGNTLNSYPYLMIFGNQ